MTGEKQMSTETTVRIFDKLEEVKDEVHEVSERLVRVEENQKSHYKENDQQHNEMVSNIAEVKEQMNEVKNRINEVESVLDERVGERKVFGSVWSLILTLLSGAALLALGGLASKILGVFGH